MDWKGVAVMAAVAVVVVVMNWIRNSGAGDARQKIAGGATLIDVRTREEFASGHLPNAINIPVDEITRRLKEVGPTDKPVVVYCRSGARSAVAASQLKAAGFVDVSNLGAMSNGQ
jgi:phage shock protein E